MVKRTPWILSAASILIAAPLLANEAPNLRGEIAAARAALFAEADGDGDGALTRAEFQTFDELLHRKLAEVRFERLDTDDDGLVTAGELEAAPMHRRRHRRQRLGQPR